MIDVRKLLEDYAFSTGVPQSHAPRAFDALRAVLDECDRWDPYALAEEVVPAVKAVIKRALEAE